MNDDNIHIQAECADCNFLFDATKGFDCPRCKSVRMSWARRITDEDYAREQLFDKVRSTMRQRLDEWAKEEQSRSRTSFLVHLTEGDRLDIAELDRMYALQQEEPDETRLPKP
jgi:hypothetical protein